MEKLYSIEITTEYGAKEIAVYCGDVLDFGEDIDILTASAFVGDYKPIPHTLFHSLHDSGISVQDLACSPEIDLRTPCSTWLSKEISFPNCGIRRIGCIEIMKLMRSSPDLQFSEQAMINSIRSYFSMLDLASIYEIKMDTVVLPLLGSGSQNIAPELIIVPLLNECIAFLKRNASVSRLYFVEKNVQKAHVIESFLKKSYHLLVCNDSSSSPAPPKNKKLAFISYSSKDKNIADNLCSKLEQNGIPAWYAPRDVVGPYAEAITLAIDRASHFIVILSENSMGSQHVLNEIDLAFQNLPSHIKFKPLRIDRSYLTASFRYYLSRQHWLDATDPPLEERLNEFVEDLLSDS